MKGAECAVFVINRGFCEASFRDYREGGWEQAARVARDLCGNHSQLRRGLQNRSPNLCGFFSLQQIWVVTPLLLEYKKAQAET